MKPPWLIVSGDFVKAGGMNQPNYELARHLAEEGFDTHLVGHRIADDLERHPNVVFHRVPKPAGSYFLSQPLINAAGRKWAKAIATRGGRVVVNGSVCDWDDINWVHHVQAVFDPRVATGLARKIKNRLQRRADLAAERRILPRARIAITNSDYTRHQIVEWLGIAAERAHTVYLGIDPSLFREPTADERAAACARLGARPGQPAVAFVGALGDSRKGFDRLFAAWIRLCRQPDWDADLVVVGVGRELPLWKTRAAEAQIGSRIRFFAFDSDDAFIPRLLWGCDALVLPSRYEGYGRPVQEALCCGVPALVSRNSGIAEQYPSGLADLLIPNPENDEDLAVRLRRWRSSTDTWREKIKPLSAMLRNHTWRKMAREIVQIVENRNAEARHESVIGGSHV